MAVNKNVMKGMLLLVASVGFLCVGTAFAQAAGGGDLGGSADTVVKQLGSFAKLITAISYVAGLAFAVGSIFKFKAHQNNPQQITIGQPIMLMFVAVALLFLPTMFKKAGESMFGSGATSGSVQGVTELGK